MPAALRREGAVVADRDIADPSVVSPRGGSTAGVVRPAPRLSQSTRCRRLHRHAWRRASRSAKWIWIDVGKPYRASRPRVTWSYAAVPRCAAAVTKTPPTLCTATSIEAALRGTFATSHPRTRCALPAPTALRTSRLTPSSPTAPPTSHSRGHARSGGRDRSRPTRSRARPAAARPSPRRSAARAHAS